MWKLTLFLVVYPGANFDNAGEVVFWSFNFKGPSDSMIFLDCFKLMHCKLFHFVLFFRLNFTECSVEYIGFFFGGTKEASKVRLVLLSSTWPWIIVLCKVWQF